MSSGSRTTLDMDLATRDERDAVVEAMITASALDLDDFFGFRVEREESRDVGSTVRFRVHAELAGRPFDTVLVDVGLSDPEIWPAEEISSPGSLSFAGLPAVSVPVLSVEQHVAEKVHALTRMYAGDQRSSRIKDLVDLLLIGETFSLDGPRLSTALTVVFETRGSHVLPTRLPEPPATWKPGLSRIIRDLGREESLNEVHVLVSRFVDPVLARRVSGRWNPEEWRWEGEPDS
jgi:hypothetical protein